MVREIAHHARLAREAGALGTHRISIDNIPLRRIVIEGLWGERHPRGIESGLGGRLDNAPAFPRIFEVLHGAQAAVLSAGPIEAEHEVDLVRFLLVYLGAVE